MNAVILAAGTGTRLKPFTQSSPKCLLQIGGATLLRRHLEALSAFKIESISIVVGYRAGQIVDEISAVDWAIPLRLIHNDDYELGSALSLLRAEAAYRNKPALIMDADLLFAHVMLKRLLGDREDNCLLVDERLQDTGEEVKVVVSPGGRVIGLGKEVSTVGGRVLGESVGVFKFSSESGAMLAEALRRATDSDPRLEYEAVMNSLLERISVGCTKVSDLPWVEIDFPSDVERAQGVVWPAIRAIEGER